ncbi:CARDB domain-containing protein [Desulfococcaceae bacterium HSG8]|nr:CARDB domain-containing protein [Desulfococcaceae bacterium HSG8]
MKKKTTAMSKNISAVLAIFCIFITMSPPFAESGQSVFEKTVTVRKQDAALPGTVNKDPYADTAAGNERNRDYGKRSDLPNLTPHKPYEWDNTIVVSDKTGTDTDDAVYAGETVYIDIACGNDSTTDISEGFYVELYADETLVTRLYDGGLSQGYYGSSKDIEHTFPESGTYTLKLVCDADNDIPESDESDNEYERNKTAYTTSSLPNLIPYGLDNTIVVSDKTGTDTDDAVYAGETVYIDIAWSNGSTTDISEGFYVELYADETLVTRLYDGGLSQGYYGSSKDIEHTFPESGTYTLKLVCDADNDIPESDESDNEYERNKTAYTASSLPNLIPYKLYDWDNTIVVSDKTGTDTDNAVYAGETVYIDIACRNDSTTDISEGFYVELYADETRITRRYYYWDGGLPQGYYGSDEDIEHTFPESGTYTLKLICDADNDIPESDESDNEYQRIIPENDNFINAISLTGVSGQTTGSNRGATKETGEPVWKSVWWAWTAPETGYFYFDTHGSSFDTLLAVYTGPDVDSLTEAASNDDDGSDNYNSSLVFQAQSGVRYYIAVDGKYGESGDIVLNRRKASRPENDDFADAVTLEGLSGQQATGSNTDATKETGEPDHAGWGGKSVWWTWTAPETGYFYFDTHGSSFDTLLAVYTGPDADSLTEIISNNNDGSDNGNSSLIFQAQSGVRYYIAVDGKPGESGDIILNRRKASRPENDDFADATALEGLSGQTTGSNTEATKETGEPDHAGSSGGKSVWWIWTAPENGYFYFDTHGSSFDTLLAVYTGPDAGSLTEIASNDNDGSDNYKSSLDFQAQSGVRYYIAVDGWYGESGDIILNRRKASHPENDDFADAAALEGLSGQTSGSNTEATKETGEPDHAGWGGGKSVWWVWTAPETGYFYFDTYGSSFGTLLAVYTGPDADSLTEIASDVYYGSLVFQAQSGVRYYIAVDGKFGESGDIILNRRKASRPENDDFADAVTLEGLSGQTTGSNIGEDMYATKETGEPDHAGRSGGKSVWWTWTAPETGYFYFDTHGSSFDTLLAVYTGPDVGSLTEIVSNDDDGSDNYNSSLAFQGNSGIRYYIAVDGKSGDIVLNFRPLCTTVSGELSMELSGQAYISGEVIESSGYVLLAFGPGGKNDCRGKTDIFREDGKWVYHFDIVSDNQGEEITFGIWNSSSGAVYNVTDTVQFAADTLLEKNIDIPLTLGSADPSAAETGEDSEMRLTGTGFDKNTRVSIYPDIANKKAVVGSMDTPGSPKGVAVSGTTVYVADGDGGLQVTDVSDPENPVIVGSADTPGSGSGVTVSGTTAYVADGEEGLQVIDVSDPENPFIIGNADTPGYAIGVTVSGTTAYVADRDDGLQVIDVSDPENPAVIGSADTPGFAKGVTVAGTTAYVADGYSGLQVTDVSDPENPVIVGSVDTPGFAAGVTVAGTTAYVANRHDGLQVIDVSDPNKPAVVGSVDTPGYGHGVTVSGTTAYVADQIGLQVIDVSDPENPAVVCSVDTSSYPLGVTVAGTTAYVAASYVLEPEYDSLQVIDLNALDNPAVIGNADTPGDALGVTVFGITAYVADGDEGLQVIDVSDPENPVIVSSVDTPDFAARVAVARTTAYVADGEGGLQVIDVSDRENPTVIGSADTPGFANGVTVAGTTAYVADGDGGLQVIDVSDPENPAVVGSVDTPGSAFGVTVARTTAYVADGSRGLQVIDVSDPGKPVIIGNANTPGSAKGVTVAGTTAYVADGDRGLQVIDVSPPDKPAIVGSANTVGHAYSVTVSGTTAYVAFGSGGLQIADVSDPYNPAIVGGTPGDAYEVTVSGSTAYVASGGDGLQIITVLSVIELTDITVLSETDISLTLPGSEIEIPGHYSLRVFNRQESHELAGAVTFLKTEDYEDLTHKKAIIVAGGGPSKGAYRNGLWEDTCTVTDSAYRALLFQGYLKENIYYLSPENRDADGNGERDDIDGDATLADLSYAVNTWAVNDPVAYDLVIYITDHGGPGTFRMSATEELYAEDLDKWLDDLQTGIPGKLVIIYDACQSGSFVPLLTPPPGKERIVIASTGPEKPAIFAPAGGLSGALSFSFHFWHQIHDGSDLASAFSFGKDIMQEFQEPQFDADSDGIPNQMNDFMTSGNIVIGRGYKRASDIPHIESVSPEQTLENTVSAALWAENITDADGIAQVRAVILPPGYDTGSPDIPVQNLPETELTDPDGDGRYEGEYTGFALPGTYSISIFATDKQGTTSLPRVTKVIQTTDHCTQGGDMNGDGSLNIGDAVMILRIMTDITVFPPCPASAADVNKDAKIGSEEAVHILRKAAGMR